MRPGTLTLAGLAAAGMVGTAAYVVLRDPGQGGEPPARQAAPTAKVAPSHPRLPERDLDPSENENKAPPSLKESQDRPAVRALLEQQRARLDELTKIKYGEPQTWPDVGSDTYRQETFEPALEAALKACKLDSERHHIDCSEPPCIAVFIQPLFEDFQDLGRCSEWSSKYGETTSAYVKTATCDQGPVRFYMISPDWPEFLTPSDPAVRDVRLQRRVGRYKELEELVCDL